MFLPLSYFSLYVFRVQVPYCFVPLCIWSHVFSNLWTSSICVQYFFNVSTDVFFFKIEFVLFCEFWSRRKTWTLLNESQYILGSILKLSFSIYVWWSPHAPCLDFYALLQVNVSSAILPLDMGTVLSWLPAQSSASEFQQHSQEAALSCLKTNTDLLTRWFQVIKYFAKPFSPVLQPLLFFIDLNIAWKVLTLATTW